MILKTCDGCKKPRKIWKTDQRKHYCSTCWKRIKPVAAIPRQSKKIKTRSKKMSKKDSEYGKLRIVFFSIPGNTCCKAGLPGCTVLATDVHHKKGRGIYYLVMETWLAVCRHCHDKIGEDPKLAIALGLSDTRMEKVKLFENRKSVINDLSTI